MGAVESLPQIPHTPPASASSKDGFESSALHSLLNPTQSLPGDPDDPYYTALFEDYVFVYDASPKSLSPLISAALNLPSGPHAVALVAALRAAVLRLRSDGASARLGALLLSTSALVDLRRAAPDDPVCLVLGAGDAERSLCPADRIDLGRSLVARIISAALHILHNEDVEFFPRNILAAIELLLVALGDELYVPHPRSEPLSGLLDRHPHPDAVVIALLDIIADASPHADRHFLLNIGSEHVAGSERISKRPASLTVAASARALALQTGFSDAISAISSRFAMAPFLNDSSRPRSIPVTSPSSTGSSDRMRIPDPHSDPYAPFGPTTPRLKSSSSPPVDADVQLGSQQMQSPESPKHLKVTSPRRADAARASNEFPSSTEATGSSPEFQACTPLVLAEHALVILSILCGPRRNSPYRKVLCELQNRSEKDDLENSYQFSRLYETLGTWLLHPSMALLAYYLFTGNKRFRTFALARTDPDVLVVPLLASLKRRCSVGVAPADAYIPAVVLLILTSDKGFCEAIDEITVVPSWLTLIEDRSRLGTEDISMSGIVLLVCSRVLQQSLAVRRREPECFLASVCLAAMGNVSGDVTHVHSFAAERLVSLLEFLGRRRRKAILYARQGDDMPMAPPRISNSPRLQRQDVESENGDGMENGSEGIGNNSTARSESFEKSEKFLWELREYVALCLEVIVSVLRSRSSVSANRHLVYTLLHREAVLESEYVSVGSEQVEGLCHILRRMTDFFGKHVDEWVDQRLEMNGGRGGVGHRGSSGISVERVFEVIDMKARHLHKDLFDGLPELRFGYEEIRIGEEWLRAYAWSLATRRTETFGNVDKAVMPITWSCFLASQ